MLDGGLEADDLFKEPVDYYKPEKQPTSACHRLQSGAEIHLRLVGHNPLWGHLLWNAGRVLADFLEENAPLLVEHRTVLELGAGAGLPSIVCALNGAKTVVVTDYPDFELIENLRQNVSSSVKSAKGNVAVEGYLWGAPVDKLMSHLCEKEPPFAFETLILADLLFNHSEHGKLISTMQNTMRKSADACALVFFTPYRPWLLHKDMEFFPLAEQAGFRVDKILEKVMDKVLFEDDPGDELVRRTVYGYMLKWKELPQVDSSSREP